MDSILTNEVREDFYIRLYFNTDEGFELSSIRRAYLDFNRTLKKEDPNRNVLKSDSEHYLLDLLKTVTKVKYKSQVDFDNQHKQWCGKLVEIWHELTIGQCQKWINMTLKYCLLFGNKRIENIEQNSAYFHIPIDSFVLKGMFNERNPKPWSKIKEYDEYMNYQLLHRQKKTGNHPIVDEFAFFNGYKSNK